MDRFSELASILYQKATKRKVFISYHHHGDQAYYDRFSQTFADKYEMLFDNSLERQIDSDDDDYVAWTIRDQNISGSSCTVVLCGQETPWRKHVDWEIKATLDMGHGLIGINLPSNAMNSTGKFTVPSRLNDNIQSRYAIWTNWSSLTQTNINNQIEEAIKRPKSLVVNNREMMSRNGTPPWRR